MVWDVTCIVPALSLALTAVVSFYSAELAHGLVFLWNVDFNADLSAWDTLNVVGMSSSEWGGVLGTRGARCVALHE